MDYWQAIILGIVEGLTEFLPVSSTGHLTIVEKMLGLDPGDPGVTGFTAVIQMGAIVAVILYFARDIWRIIDGWSVGLFKPELRGTLDHRMGWYVIVGSIPIGVVGLLVKDVITGRLRSLWVVGARADRVERGDAVRRAARPPGPRRERDLTLHRRDRGRPGAVLALVPGVSRSGATISAGLLRGLDRVTATRLSFFLSIPALLAAGLFELKDALGGRHRRRATALGDLVSFVVAYAAIAWLLRFVAAPLDRVVRALPRRARPAADRAAGDRRDHRRPDGGGESQPDFLKNTVGTDAGHHHQAAGRRSSRSASAAPA